MVSHHITFKESFSFKSTEIEKEAAICEIAVACEGEVIPMRKLNCFGLKGNISWLHK